MNDDNQTYRMKGGRVLTDADLDALADEAERGYDPAQIVRSPGRPRMGAAPAVVLPVRLHPDLHTAAKQRAAIERTSVSELVRHAVARYLLTETPASVPAGAAGDLEALADEAEAGYSVATFRPKPRARVRTQVVPIRVPPELKAELEARAEAEATSVSEIVRAALRALLGSPEPDPPTTTAPSRRVRRRTWH